MQFLHTLKINKRYAIICIVGFVLNMIAYYRGFLSPDSFDQYTQALSGHYNDWHPPVMAALWSVLNKMYRGTILILAFQLSLLWLSAYILFISIKSRLWHILILLLVLAPFVQNFAGYIIKDSQMAFSWLLAFAIMYRLAINEAKFRIPEAIVCFLLIVYGCWVRINALPGVLPLCYMFCKLVFTKKNSYWIFAISLLFLCFIKLGNWIFNNKIVNAEISYPQAKIYMHDIDGIYAKTGHNFYPDYLNKNPLFDSITLRKGYNPATFDHLWWDANGMAPYLVTDEKTIKELRLAWINAISKYPTVYFKNRFLGFLYYLRIKNSGSPLYYYYATVIPDVRYPEISFHPNFISKIFIRPLIWQSGIPYFKPWFWYLLNLVLFAFVSAFRNPASKSAFIVLLSSSLLYSLPSFFVFPCDTDFRYFYWNCIACALATCILLVDRFYYVKYYDVQK